MSNIDSQPIEQQSSVVEWAVGRQGADVKEADSNLQAVVKYTPTGFLMAAICGVGPGKEGRKATQISQDIFQSYTHQSLTDLFNRCDRQSTETCGTFISAAILNHAQHTVTWLGVGNVQGVLFHRSPTANPRFQNLVLQPGHVGDGQFIVREATYPIRFGDLIFLASAGVNGEFVQALPIEGKPRIVADTLLGSYVNKKEDSLMLVARYMGGN